MRTIKNFIHFLEAIFANLYFGFPGRKLRIVGVTGTDGKTTTVSLIYEILRRAGKKVAKITTVEAEIDGKRYDLKFHGTTPSAFVIQKFLSNAVRSGITDAVLEVSSHGLDQFRTWGIPFEVGVLTNITHEHLDYHKTYGSYLIAKLKLLLNAKTAVINKSDRSFSLLEKKLPNKQVFTYSTREQGADYTPTKFLFETSLFGEFNLENCLASIAAAKILGIGDKIIRSALKDFRAPDGREEIIYDKEFTVMIDFAHTPNAIEKLLSEISKIKKGRLIHVFSATGRRDPSKRPFMGEASARYAQIIILTAEDPRDEEVQKINEQIRKGISAKFVFRSEEEEISDESAHMLFEIPDREEAVRFAIQIARPGDFVVFTGKGHEREMYVKDGALPFNEKEIALDAIKAKTF